MVRMFLICSRELISIGSLGASIQIHNSKSKHANVLLNYSFHWLKLEQLNLEISDMCLERKPWDIA